MVEDKEQTIINLHKTLSCYVYRYLQDKWYLESIAKHFLGLAIVFAIMVFLLV